jgi:hypothetical protein
VRSLSVDRRKSGLEIEISSGDLGKPLGDDDCWPNVSSAWKRGCGDGGTWRAYDEGR